MLDGEQHELLRDSPNCPGRRVQASREQQPARMAGGWRGSLLEERLSRAQPGITAPRVGSHLGRLGEFLCIQTPRRDVTGHMKPMLNLLGAQEEGN